jgi:hypothetical protein
MDIIEFTNLYFFQFINNDNLLCIQYNFLINFASQNSAGKGQSTNILVLNPTYDNLWK